MAEWFERLDRLFDRLHFDPLHIEVGGAPWKTIVLTEVAVEGRLAGRPYRNVLFQRIVLRFGRIVSVRTLEDTQHLQAALTEAAGSGVDEALAPPIVG